MNEEWEELVSSWMHIKDDEQQIQWKKGELADQVGVRYGDASLLQFAMEVGETVKSLEAYRRTYRAYSEDQRGRNLSYTHYLVASYADKYDKGDKEFETNKREKLLEKAEERGWSTRRLRAEISGADKTPEENIVDYVNKFCGRIMQYERMEPELALSVCAKIQSTLELFKDEHLG